MCITAFMSYMYVINLLYFIPRYGKVDKLVNLFGILQALVAFVQDDKDDLRSIVSGNHQFVFVCRRPLLLVAVSQTCQSVSQVCVYVQSWWMLAHCNA